jgi:hypothetical protein
MGAQGARNGRKRRFPARAGGGVATRRASPPNFSAVHALRITYRAINACCLLPKKRDIENLNPTATFTGRVLIAAVVTTASNGRATVTTAKFHY